jgi:hypothetical protein
VDGGARLLPPCVSIDTIHLALGLITIGEGVEVITDSEIPPKT